MTKSVYQKIILLVAGGLIVLLPACNGSDSCNAKIREVPFTKIHLDDIFWAPRIEVNRTVSIPSAFYQCEINGRFDNFAIAGGLIEGEHRGDFSFDDTDPYKIIEGASYSLAAKYDPGLDRYLDSVIRIIAAAQEPDGYLTTCVTNKVERLSGWWGSSRWEKINSHELYNSGHMYESAVAHYLATGKRTFLDVAIKNADLICEVFGPGDGQKHVPSGHPIVEMALAKLYKVTGEEKYLDLAKYFIEETGRGTDGHRLNAYSQDHMPILDQEEIVGHAVRAGYLYSGVADMASLTNDQEYFKALCRIWDNMAGKKLYITGGIGSRSQGEGFGPGYELHNHNAYCETCASIANVYWNYRMFLATGDAKYMDVLERVLYNGVISGVSLGGDAFFYDNPLESMGQHLRQPWFGCACCPGNITRFMASVPGYMYAVQGNDIFVNLYVQGTAQVETPAGEIQLEQVTRHPWEGNVKLTVNPSVDTRFALKLRIPGWAQDAPVPTDLYSFVNGEGEYTVTVNGKKVTGKPQKGYVNIERTWSTGDLVEIEFPMQVRQIRAHEAVADDRGKLAVQRGPVVYCIEGKDQNDNTVFNKYIPENTPFTTHFDGELLNGVTVLTGTAMQVEPDGTEETVPFTAIPYATWNNRGADEMAVWIPQAAEYARPVPEPTIASRARAATVGRRHNQDGHAGRTGALEELSDEAFGFNDQWNPVNSADRSKPYFYWWLRYGSKESAGYVFEKPEKVSSVEVYWLDFDHYDGNFRVPESWQLYCEKDNRWYPVEALTEYTVDKDRYNKLEFKPVTTRALKLSVKLQEGVSGGIIEWKVK
jgi:hypothetical protein